MVVIEPVTSIKNAKKKSKLSSYRLRSRFIAAILLATVVVFSALFSLAVPYYIETETSMNRIGIELTGISILFEENGSSYEPAGVIIQIRVYNPSAHYKLLFSHFQIRHIVLNGYQIKYFRKSNAINQEIGPLSNRTISIIQERTYMQGEDIQVLKNAREDSTWHWKLGEHYNEAKSWFIMNYRYQEKRIVMNTDITEVIII